MEHNFKNKTVKPNLWLTGLAVLCAAGLIAYMLSAGPAPAAVQPLTASESKEGQAKIISTPASYKAAEHFQTSNAELPQHEFGTLQISKSKINRGMQLLAKQGHVIGQLVSPDGTQMAYMLHRKQQTDGKGWAQMDVVLVDPQTQQILTEPIGYTFGEPLEAAIQSSGLCGYVSNDELLYTTVRNDKEEWVYLLNKFNVKEKTVIPVMELYRYSAGNGQPPVIYSSAVAPDKKHLLVRDSIYGITTYDLATGELKKWLPGSNEVKPGEYFELVPDKGVVLYSTTRFQSDIWRIDLNTMTAGQPFSAEPGLVDIGMDVSGKIMYYNFTYDRRTEHVMTGDKHSQVIPYGVQITDLQGKPLSRFSLPKDAKERLEFGGYSEAKQAVLLHKFTMTADASGQPYKKTAGWLLGDMKTGAMTALTSTAIPDGWDSHDIVFGQVAMNAASPAAQQQVFVHVLDGSYYSGKWKTKRLQLLQDEDIVIFEDEQNKRLFVSSFTRPDLVVAALNYKKYNWDNDKFELLKGHWLTRFQKLPEGDKLYFFQWS